MPRLIVRGARLAETGEARDIAVDGGRIAEIAEVGGSIGAHPGDAEIDGRGKWLFPGLIDLQVNDIEWLARGLEPPEKHAERIREVARHHAKRGITGVVLATLAAPLDEILSYLAGMALILDEPRQATDSVFLGGLVEGTFMNPAFHGAHNPKWVYRPDLGIFDRLLATGALRLLNVAPEMDGDAMEVIRRAASHGVTVGCGHAKPHAACLREAVAAGLRYIIHLGNGPTGSSLKVFNDGGMLEEALRNDELTVTVIIDGYHVHPALVRDFIERKELARVIGVSDAGFALGAPAGEFEVFGIRGTRNADGAYLHVVPSPAKDAPNPRSSDAVALFGSAVDQLRVLEVAVDILTHERSGVYTRRHPALSLEEALRAAVEMLSTNPARLLGLSERGRITTGARADLFLADVDVERGPARVRPRTILAGGERVEPAESI